VETQLISSPRTSSQNLQVAALVVLATITSSISAAPADAQQPRDVNRAEAQAVLDQGVEAYKSGQLDAAIADFRRAKELDPSSVTARIYLATAYGAQYIPGAPSEENLAMGRQALEEYQGVLERDEANLAAIDGAGSILFFMAANPLDRDKMNEAKSYPQRHIELKPDDPQPYYWIGVIDWTICYKTNQSMRAKWSKENPNGNLAPAEPLPESVRRDFASQCQQTVDEGIAQTKHAIQRKPEYDDALAYLNLLYRLKADMEETQAARDADIQKAEDLVDQVMNIKKKKAEAAPPQ
jgi:tetratricopeptide (TPR) repeat protein